MRVFGSFIKQKEKSDRKNMRFSDDCCKLKVSAAKLNDPERVIVESQL